MSDSTDQAPEDSFPIGLIEALSENPFLAQPVDKLIDALYKKSLIDARDIASLAIHIRQLGYNSVASIVSDNRFTQFFSFSERIKQIKKSIIDILREQGVSDDFFTPNDDVILPGISPSSFIVDQTRSENSIRLINAAAEIIRSGLAPQTVSLSGHLEQQPAGSVIIVTERRPSRTDKWANAVAAPIAEALRRIERRFIDTAEKAAVETAREIASGPQTEEAILGAIAEVTKRVEGNASAAEALFLDLAARLEAACQNRMAELEAAYQDRLAHLNAAIARAEEAATNVDRALDKTASHAAYQASAVFAAAMEEISERTAEAKSAATRAHDAADKAEHAAANVPTFILQEDIFSKPATEKADPHISQNRVKIEDQTEMTDLVRSLVEHPHYTTRFDELGLKGRPANILKNDNLIYVLLITRMTERELLRIPNSGRISVGEIRAALEERQLSLSKTSLSDEDFKGLLEALTTARQIRDAAGLRPGQSCMIAPKASRPEGVGSAAVDDPRP